MSRFNNNNNNDKNNNNNNNNINTCVMLSLDTPILI